jgi:hypothetical protein
MERGEGIILVKQVFPEYLQFIAARRRDPLMRFDFLIQPLKEPPLRGSPPLRKGIVIKGGRLKKSKRISASGRSSDSRSARPDSFLKEQYRVRYRVRPASKENRCWMGEGGWVVASAAPFCRFSVPQAFSTCTLFSARPSCNIRRAACATGSTSRRARQSRVAHPSNWPSWWPR